jgi:hypothetical protein
VEDRNECHCCRRDDPRRLRTSNWGRRVFVMVVFSEMTRVSLVQGTPINRNGDEGQGGAPRSSFRRVIEGRQNGGRGRVSRGWRRGRDKRVSFLQVNDKERQERWVRWEGRAVAVVVFLCVGLPRCSGSQALWGKCRLRQGRLSVAAQDRLQPRTSIIRAGRAGHAWPRNQIIK